VSADRVRGADSVAAAIDQLQSLPAADQLLLTGSFVTVAQALERAKQE
jgi:folylpolyglutamate synthase/dihydropteroate synthase